MDQALKSPTYSETTSGDRDLVWILPSAELAERFADLLLETSGLEARVCGLSGAALLIKVTYPPELTSQVFFAIFLLKQIHTRIVPLEAALALPSSTPPPEA